MNDRFKVTSIEQTPGDKHQQEITRLENYVASTFHKKTRLYEVLDEFIFGDGEASAD